MDKYYTPSIEEFHVGFEYEFKGMTLTMNMLDLKTNKLEIVGESTPIWEHETINMDIWTVRSNTQINVLLHNSQIRVKYLDIDDIKSLGWTDIAMSKMGNSFQNFILYETNGIVKAIKYQHLLWKIYYNTLSKKCIIRLDNYSTNGIDLQIFNGTIKNKSELKVLMKQLNI